MMNAQPKHFSRLYTRIPDEPTFELNNSNITWNSDLIGWLESSNSNLMSLIPECHQSKHDTFPKAVGSNVSSGSSRSSGKSSTSSSPVSFENSSEENVWEDFRKNGITKDFVKDLGEITGRPWNYDYKKKAQASAVKSSAVKSGPTFCVFCKNNDRPSEEYESHRIRDEKGVTTCPILRKYKCPICKKVGGNSGHTTRYCPENKRSSWGPGRVFVP